MYMKNVSCNIDLPLKDDRRFAFLLLIVSVFVVLTIKLRTLYMYGQCCILSPVYVLCFMLLVFSIYMDYFVGKRCS